MQFGMGQRRFGEDDGTDLTAVKSVSALCGNWFPVEEGVRLRRGEG